MSWTNPNGWSAPKTNTGEPPSNPIHGNDGMGTGVPWTPANGIANTDLDRIETNIKGLHTLLCQSGTVAVTVDFPYFTVAESSVWNWTRINNLIILGMREMSSVGFTANTELQIIPDTVWPDEILPEKELIVPCIFRKNIQIAGQGPGYRPGYLLFPSINNAAIVCYITDLNAGFDCYCEGLGAMEGFSDRHFGAGVVKKSIPEQTIFWMVDRSPIVATTTTPSP